MTDVTKKWNLNVYFISIHLNLNIRSHMWPVAVILESMYLEHVFLIWAALKDGPSPWQQMWPWGEEVKLSLALSQLSEGWRVSGPGR